MLHFLHFLHIDWVGISSCIVPIGVAILSHKLKHQTIEESNEIKVTIARTEKEADIQVAQITADSARCIELMRENSDLREQQRLDTLELADLRSRLNICMAKEETAKQVLSLPEKKPPQ